MGIQSNHNVLWGGRPIGNGTHTVHAQYSQIHTCIGKFEPLPLPLWEAVSALTKMHIYMHYAGMHVLQHSNVKCCMYQRLSLGENLCTWE